MDRMKRISLLIALVAASCGELAAQSAMLRHGDRSYRSMSYSKAIEYYEMAFKLVEPDAERMRRHSARRAS